MSLFVVTVEATDIEGNGDYFDVAVLAEKERGARLAASYAMAGKGLLGVRSVGVRLVDPYKTGVVLVARKES